MLGRERLLTIALVLFAACGRTAPLTSDGAAASTSSPDPVRGVWVNDDTLSGPPRIVIENLQFSFNAGAWEEESLEDPVHGAPHRQVNLGTYVVDDDAIEMTVTSSSCAGLRAVPTPSATFERHGDRMILDWKNDRTAADAPTPVYLRRADVLSDLGDVGCNVGGSFLSNPVTPLPW